MTNAARKPNHWSRPHPESILSTGSVEVGSDSLYYTASGVAESGAVILFLHESGGTGITWNGQLSGLAQRARCLVPDLPGHGQSEGFGHQTIAEYRRSMLGFLDALAIRWPVVIAGVCLGAAIAVDIALHTPDRVAGLVLAGLYEGGRASAETRLRAALGEAPSRFVESLFSESVSARLKSEHLQRWRKTAPTVRYADLIAVANYPMREGLRSLRQRVLFIGGQQDRIATPGYTALMAMEAPQGQQVVIGEAGCLSMVERPEAFNRAVGAFVQEVQPVQVLVSGPVSRGGYRRFS